MSTRFRSILETLVIGFVIVAMLAFIFWPRIEDREVGLRRVNVERRALYLECLHQYSLGVVIGEDLDYNLDDNRAVVIDYCAALAGLDPADVQPKGADDE